MEQGFTIVQQRVPTMYFIGVTTGQSSMMRIFPLWAEVLGLNHAQLVGVDLPLHAAPEQYRQAIAQIKNDPLSLGALVTTHKIDLLQAASDMFDALDRYAQLCQEVSCIVKRDGQLIGYAKDPINSGLALQQIIEPHRVRRGERGVGRMGGPLWSPGEGQVLCLGAGGSGTAITVNLLAQPDAGDRPERLVIVSRNQPALDKLRAIVEQLPATIEIDYVLTEDPHRNDRLMAELPQGSLVINATGMGKDRPGSPITDEGVFPMHGIAWELNYRGKLDFLHQALAQQELRHLNVHDGWRYFVISWIDHIAEVFHIKVTTEQFDQLAQKAEMIRK
jgi:shikimate dehydrogenase